MIGAGRRCEMAEILHNTGFIPFSYEISKNCPISKYAKIVIGKKWNDEYIIEHLSNTIKNNGIDIVLGFQDSAIPILGELVENVELSNKVCSVKKDIGQICLDKKLFESFISLNFKEIYPKVNIGDLGILKPRYGFGSKGIHKKTINDSDLNKEDYIVQKYIEGVEWSVDAYFSKEGKFIDGVTRTRDRVGDGEVISSKTILNKDIYNLTREIGECLKFTGPGSFQFREEEKTGKIFIQEINARFGGGVTFSIHSGFKVLDYIKSEYLENKIIMPEISPIWKQGMILERYYKDFYIDSNEK